MFGLTPQAIAFGLTQYLVLLLALSVHESAHAFSALKMGDDTAARLGRVSLNPLDHIDPIGTVLIPLLQIFSVQLFGASLPMIGWAKPTPVAPSNFRELARGHIIVSAAGPASNLVLALVFAVALFVAKQLGVPMVLDNPVTFFLYAGVSINAALLVFNLIPLPPLDGSWIASWGLPRSIARHYDRIFEPYGQWILLILVFTGILGWFLVPVVQIIIALLLAFV